MLVKVAGLKNSSFWQVHVVDAAIAAEAPKVKRAPPSMSCEVCVLRSKLVGMPKPRRHADPLVHGRQPEAARRARRTARNSRLSRCSRPTCQAYCVSSVSSGSALRVGEQNPPGAVRSSWSRAVVWLLCTRPPKARSVVGQQAERLLEIAGGGLLREIVAVDGRIVQVHGCGRSHSRYRRGRSR